MAIDPKNPHPRNLPFDPSVPFGSPLSNEQYAPVASQGAPRAPMPQMAPMVAHTPPMAPVAAPMAPEASIERKSGLPTPPPRKERAKLWDKEHWAETLGAIGQGFLSSNSFSGGLGAAGANVQDLRARNAEAMRDHSTIGGPDDAFEIDVDPTTRERTFRPIKEVQDYLTEKARKAQAPDGKETVTMRSSTMAAIMRLPPEQRAQAYSDFVADSSRLGYDMGLPPEFNPDVAQAMADQGAPVGFFQKLAETHDNHAASQADKDRNFSLRAAESASRNSNRASANSRAERKLRQAPPSKRGGSVSSANSDLNY